MQTMFKYTYEYLFRDDILGFLPNAECSCVSHHVMDVSTWAYVDLLIFSEYLQSILYPAYLTLVEIVPIDGQLPPLC